MRKFRRVVLILLLLLIALVAVACYLLRPDRTLDLKYADISWKAKLNKMIENRIPMLTLDEAEVNNLAKKKIAEYNSESKLPVPVQGAEFKLHGDRLTADVIAGWGFIRTEALIEFQMHYNGTMLELKPLSMKVKGHQISPSTVGLGTLEVDPAKDLPSVIKVNDMKFHDKEIEMRFTVNWLRLPMLIW